MNGMRFSLGKLLLVIALVALACAGFVSPTAGAASLTFTVTVAGFAFSMLRALALDGRRRIFAVTFAVAGSIYFVGVMGLPFRTFGKAIATNYPIAVLAQQRFKETLTSWPASSGGAGSPQPNIYEMYPLDYLIQSNTDYFSNEAMF